MTNKLEGQIRLVMSTCMKIFRNDFFQAFVRDPDGYYIEFCNCDELDNFLHRKQSENVSYEEQLRRKHSVSSINSVQKYGQRLRRKSQEAKLVVQQRNWKVRTLFGTLEFQ